MRRRFPLLALGALALALGPVLVGAAPPSEKTGKAPNLETPSAEEIEETLPEGKTLTGHELYERFLKNRKRLRTFIQQGRILSTDPADNPQETRFYLRWKDYRDANDDPVDDLSAKMLLTFVGPRELEHTSYLYIQKGDGRDEQFMYSPDRQRVQRVHIRGQNLAGTDFSLDDFLVSLDDIEDASYRRLPDVTIDGVKCYVVEAVMKPAATSRYTRSIASLEQEHYVPLRTRYWDDAGVEAKELTSPHKAIKEFDGVWVPTESTVVDLLEDTRSTMYIETLEPNPKLAEREFALSELTLRR